MGHKGNRCQTEYGDATWGTTWRWRRSAVSDCFLVEIVAIRCQILRRQCTKFDFGWGYFPNPLQEAAYSAPRLSSCISGVLLLREKKVGRNRIARNGARRGGKENAKLLSAAIIYVRRITVSYPSVDCSVRFSSVTITCMGL